MGIVPAQGFLLIEVLENTEEDGIYMPPAPGDEPMRGKVLAVGSSRKLESGSYLPAPETGEEDDPITAGDIIFFKKHTVNQLPEKDGVKRGFIPFEVVMGLDTGEDK